MLNWLLRKRTSSPAGEANGARAAGTQAVTAAAPVAAPSGAEWVGRVEAARGDETALLEIARAAPLLDVKLAAVAAMATEAGLRLAEREFRSRQRKVHQLVRQRLAALVARRETRARGSALVAAARALLAEAPLPANRLVELDEAWRALDAAELDVPLREEFSTLRERLDAALREQGEREQRERRWAAAAARAGQSLRCAHAAGDEAAILQAIAAAEALRGARPPAAASSDGVVAELCAAIETAQAALADLREAARAASVPPLPTVIATRKPAPPPAGDVWPRLDALLQQAEEALAEGRSAALDDRLQAADACLATAAGLAPPAALRSRLQALHAEQARLAGWQRWGGALARETLVDEAERLARATAGAAAGAARLNLRAHGEALRSLRARWRELDRTGAAASQTLWQRFDSALAQAHAPLAAQQAALRAAREQNLAAREALLALLEATPVDDASPRDLLQALDAFHAAWRPLGPPEHTVPAAARDALQRRRQEAIRRVAAPLEAARDAAQGERESLVRRAEALAGESAAPSRLHEATAEVRELQSAWKGLARALPLGRATEAVLWGRFRAACDQVFAHRQAAAEARDAEQAATAALRESLLLRLATVDLGAPDASSQVDAVDREWRAVPPAPRGAAESLERRYRDARAAAQEGLETRRRAQWQAQCDALLACLRDCEAREDGGVGSAAGEGAAFDGLPAAWREALTRRAAQAPPGPERDARPVDDALLELEAALDLSACVEAEAARRELKLRQLKDTLEGRAARQVARPVDTVGRIAALLCRAGLGAPQRARLHALVAALRDAGRAPS